jgi:hypothetical protein
MSCDSGMIQVEVMRTLTHEYPSDQVSGEIRNMEAKGWAVRQIMPRMNELWFLVVYEDNR